MSFNKKLVLVAFTLALLVASYGAAALCERTGVWCDSDAMCKSICGEKGGYCSTEHVVGDPSCVCGGPPCSGRPAAASTTGDGAPLEKQAATATATATATTAGRLN